MGPLWTIYLMFVSFTLSECIITSRKYVAKLELNNKISNGELLGEYGSTSMRECAALCQGACRIYGFNPQMKKCRTHKIFTSELSDEAGWIYYSFDFTPKDCKNLRDNGHSNTGVYEIYPFGIRSRAVKVYCDMKTLDGGWTAIQKRVNGFLSFDRGWTEYKNGFGDPEQDFWVGNDVIHQLTKENNSLLYVCITLQNGSTLYEMYDRFSVSDEAGKYQLFLAGPASGSLGDCMLDTGVSTTDLSGMSFSTPDRDNDRYSGGNCASMYHGGWWFNACYWAFLNGPWSSSKWNFLEGAGTSVRETTMLIKDH